VLEFDYGTFAEMIFNFFICNKKMLILSALFSAENHLFGFDVFFSSKVAD
jgi:hypothetical protein